MNVRSLNFKVSVIVGILVVCSALIAVMSWRSLGELNSTLTRITNVTVPRIDRDHMMKEIFLTQVINERNFALNPAGGPAREAARKYISERHKEMAEVLEERKALADEAGVKRIAAFEAVYKEWTDLNTQVTELFDKGQDKEALNILVTKGRDVRVRGTEIVDTMVKSNNERMQADQKSAEASFARSRDLLLGTVVGALLFGIACAFLVLRSLSAGINRVISELTDNSTQVSGASQQISVSSEQLAEASSEQAASLEETVATLEELTSMIKINADNAREAARLSGETSQVASRGDQEIHSLMDSMQAISQDSKRIEEIINVIDDIAFQTNLLALNAAVEAARAGEQGKGFAVVAEAVRNLAQRSSSAAKDITELIKGSVEKIDRGAHQAQQSGRVLGEIVQSAQKVSSLNAEIASASEEQSNGVNQISKAMNQLDQVTQVNAATSEEAAAASQELSAQAQQLDKVVDLLTYTIKGVRREIAAAASGAQSKAKTIDIKSARRHPAPKVAPHKVSSVKSDSMDDWGKVGTTDGF
ncbi:methyl-accepting chemotaxis protein [Bdellovibrio bacteriovorus]|uniref:Putative methyl accepting chemotaxis protein n=1 Tax=Bdellovibrio bacteriovorus (strain ATCC 15356 / DSM 50701 / NCIMB 9529 / HD100) TaxID=264462 RepID=Q6MNB9_BDEBA|nr:methyl-accepting chemotaxis protein [Bdellovibrio bacteriovorus]CAE79233.1 putative methyl accepting chemotaxis protein [Bdellovibrio bacteriovorus HD100]